MNFNTINYRSSYLITIILPCYNEEAIIETNLKTITEYLNNSNFNYEILIINDGSSDRTGDIADELEKGTKNIRVIHHP